MVKALHHICIETNDYEKSLLFYSDCFGFHVINDHVNFHGREHCSWIKSGDVLIELQTPKIEDYEGKSVGNKKYGLQHICLSVESLYKAVEKIKNIGKYEFMKKNNEEIYSVMDSFIAKVVSPEGVVIELRE